jgi:hypothetical protein
VQPRSSRRRRLHAALAASPLALFALAGAAVQAARAPYDTGQAVTIQGVVSDAKGRPLPDLKVTLEASRVGFAVYPWGNRKREVATGSAQTNPRGEYGLQFPWNRRFNRFELVVAVPVAAPQGEELQELWRSDVTRRVLQGSPVAVPVTLEDTRFLDTLRQFLGSLTTDEERRAYRQAGKPDRVDRVLIGGEQMTTWWYFRAGKAFRFRGGHLEKVEEFPPVQPLS